MNLEKFIGKVVEGEMRFRGKCIGYLPRVSDLVIIWGKGGQVNYIPAAKAKIVR